MPGRTMSKVPGQRGREVGTGEKKKKLRKISTKRLGNFAAGRPRREPRALKLGPPWLPVRPGWGPEGRAAAAPQQPGPGAAPWLFPRPRPTALALLLLPGTGKDKRKRRGKRWLFIIVLFCFYRQSGVCRKNSFEATTPSSAKTASVRAQP